jgi:hypothetical protein
MEDVPKIKREFLTDLLTSETNEARSLLPEDIKGLLSRIKSKKMQNTIKLENNIILVSCTTKAY